MRYSNDLMVVGFGVDVSPVDVEENILETAISSAEVVLVTHMKTTRSSAQTPPLPAMAMTV